MNNRESKAVSAHGWGTMLAVGVLVFLYAALCIAASAVGYANRQEILKPVDGSPTSTVEVILTPQILVHKPNTNDVVKFEDFSNNLLNWSLYYPNGKVETINGKLVVQSYTAGSFTIAENEKFLPPGDKYYVQADLVTDINTNNSYGLIFGFDNNLGTFYSFVIIPNMLEFGLLKHTRGTWSQLIPFSNSNESIKPYPGVNTLSVYFNKGAIELFINGKSIASYLDKDPFQYVGVGAYVNNSGFRLIIDNFFAYNNK